jgi:hypothetical protein
MLRFAVVVLLLVSVSLRNFSSASDKIPQPVPAPDAARAFCASVAQRLPRLGAQGCAAAGLTSNGGRSVQGVPIFYREQPSTAKNAIRVLVIGGIHGDELTASETVFRWIGRLAGDDAQPYHWKVVPLLNPDGMFAQPARRTNANGVDLNRNFPTPDWEVKARQYWERTVNKDPRRYPGPRPLSEPETRWLHEQLESFRPQAIVSVHAPLGVLDFDGPAPAPSRIGRLYLDQIGVYPGSLGNYSGVYRGIPVVTLELPHALVMPTPFEQDRIWRDMLRWLRQRLVLSGAGRGK